LVAQTPTPVQRSRHRVGRLHLEVEVLDVQRAERGDDLAHEPGPDSRAARVWVHVEVRDRPETARALARKRKTNGRPFVVLRDEGNLRVDDLPNLGELLLLVGRAFVGG